MNIVLLSSCRCSAAKPIWVIAVSKRVIDRHRSVAWNESLASRVQSRLHLALAVTSTLFLIPAVASATWSIVAVDPQTKEVGISGASCTGDSSVIAGIAPGKGVIAAQGLWNPRGRDHGVEMLSGGASPTEVIEILANTNFDWLGFLPVYKLRQYGVAALGFEDAPAGFTGSWTFDWHGDAQGYGVSAQGNILHGYEVIEEALATFESKPSTCPFTLADRLMAALEAGAAKGGDNRCSRDQAALSAFIIVAKPEDDANDPFLRLVVPNQDKGDANPVKLLREQYDQWRTANLPDDSGCGVALSKTVQPEPNDNTGGQVDAPKFSIPSPRDVGAPARITDKGNIAWVLPKSCCSRPRTAAAELHR